MWPFGKKNIVEVKKDDREDDDFRHLPIVGEVKNFDWAHYQAIAHGGIHPAYQDEYDFVPTIRVLKSLYSREPWVSFCMNAISRQFMNARHVLAFRTSDDGDEQVIFQHPLLRFLSSAGQENPSFFTANNIIDMVLTGNAYVWLSPNLLDKKRIPSERVDLKFENGKRVAYCITNYDGDITGLGVPNLTLSPEEVLHFMMPNPYTPWVGMSLFMAINLPVLIDKYGREFIAGFFVRGGHLSGIIETEATNADQLTRFVRTIMQTIGGRRNTHADKVLPKGAKWASSASKFSEIQLIELLKENQTLFRAATGTTNTVLGISENVNRATAMAEMEHFWKMTILPLQYIYCSAIKHSSLWKRFGLDDRFELKFDNSKVDYLDDFERKLEQDAKLKPVASVNERRQILGFDPVERLGDKFEEEMKPVPSVSPFGLSVPQEMLATKSAVPVDEIAIIKAELPEMQDPTDRVDAYFQREFARWEDITLANIKDLEKAREIIEKRADAFAEGYADMVLPSMMRTYDYHINRIKKTKSFKRKDESDATAKLEELKERGKRVLRGKAFTNGKKSFVDYSKNNMKRIHESIAQEIDSGKNFDDVAVSVRQQFGEFYEGQAKTIVRTEFASAVAQSNYQFGNDLATICKRMTKTWISMGDDGHTRAKHLALDNITIGEDVDADEVADLPFELNGSEYLRYPKDENGEPEDVVNCRCDLVWDVADWE